MADTGLLDFFASPEGQGLLAAGFGAMGSRNPWVGLSRGGLLGLQAYGQASEMQANRQRQQAMDDRQAQIFDWQKTAHQQQQDALAKSQAQAAAQQNYLGSIGKVTSPVVGAQPNQADPRQMLGLGFDPKFIETYMNAGNLGKAKIKDFKEIRNPDGSVSVVGFDEFGNVTNTKQTPFKAPDIRDFGGYVGGVDPITGKVTNYGQKTMSAAERDASARGWSGLNLQRDQFAYSKSKDAQDRADKMAGGAGNATEDERKAAGWLAQASSAWSNMQKAMGGVDPKTGKFKNPDVAMPGLPDAIAAIPSFGLGEVVGNTMRSPARQQFNQASSSMGEAILRAATGSGVNQYEAEQKVRELTPVFGEDPSTTEQKMQAIPVYLESLKARAGRAAPRDWSVPVVNAPGDSAGWSIRPK